MAESITPNLDKWDTGVDRALVNTPNNMANEERIDNLRNLDAAIGKFRQEVSEFRQYCQGKIKNQDQYLRGFDQKLSEESKMEGVNMQQIELFINGAATALEGIVNQCRARGLTPNLAGQEARFASYFKGKPIWDMTWLTRLPPEQTFISQRNQRPGQSSIPGQRAQAGNIPSGVDPAKAAEIAARDN